ncbi:MAG: hypothetical protein J0H94_12985 [Rhizobiales bacterium]|nr:hypothetical protein [Hyphomicrobiales bacterium]
MKTDFRIPSLPGATPPREGNERIGADHVFAPLALPHLLARSIRLRPIVQVEERRYRWKRDDEAVN